MFCKLFETEKHGQLLALRGTNDAHEPCVSFKFEPHETLGVCSYELAFNATEEGDASADRLINGLDEAQIVSIISETFDSLAKGFGETTCP